MARLTIITSHCACVTLLMLLAQCTMLLAFQPHFAPKPIVTSQLVGGFRRPPSTTVALAPATSTTDEEVPVTNAEPTRDTSRQQQNEIARIQQDLLDLSQQTSRGFKATDSEKRRARQLISDLARYFDASKVQPVRAYYKNLPLDGSSNSEPTKRLSLEGKWELVFTDAPDITSLDQNNLAQLGRIGQECQAPYIKNVIEWSRPAWANNLPSVLTGTDADARILQKVVTLATASPQQPATVQLQVAGLQIATAKDDDDDDEAGTDHDSTTTSTTTKNDDPNRWLLPDAVRRKGWIAGLFQERPIDWVNPNRPLPFGKFEVLYLDETWRVTRTGQNHIAVNLRLPNDEAWF